MAWEVWLFEQPEPGEERPSRLISVAECPREYGRADAHRWADAQVAEYLKMGGPIVTAVVLPERIY